MLCLLAFADNSTLQTFTLITSKRHVFHYHCIRSEQLNIIMELYPFGDALFSTHHGKYSPRPASLGPIVLRSSPEDDQDSMVARLRWKFPLQCKEIKAPIENIYQWFDPYDTHRHGYAFLHSVLSTIAFQNSVRAGQLNSFAEKWKKANPGRFDAIKYYSVDMFIRDELWEFGHEFLADVAQILHASRYSTTPHCKSMF